MLLDPTDNKPTRVGIRVGDERQPRAVLEAHRQGDRVTWKHATTTPDAQQAAPPPRLREHYETELVGRLTEKFGYSSRMQVPRLLKITLNMGVGDAKQSTPVLEAATEQLDDDHRPAPERAPGAQVDRQLQAPRGHAGRRLRDPARRPHVGVPRPPDLDRDPADPRLPRAQPALVRRSRQLLARRPRAAHLPGDRLRLDQRGPRPRHRDDHHRRDRRGGVRAPARARHAVRPGGAPGQRSTPLPRKRRSAATRRPASGPRPSRRRSSSSRRRTPRPTPSPSAPRRARKARRPPRAAKRLQATTKVRGLIDGEDVTEGCPAGGRRSSRPAGTTAAASAAARAPTTASSASAGSACARPRTRATSPA